MNWELVLDNSVRKQLRRIPQYDVERLLVAIHELVVNPFAGDIEKMGGESRIWRRRVGSYRIIYEILKEKRIIHVLDLRRRTSSTY